MRLGRSCRRLHPRFRSHHVLPWASFRLQDEFSIVEYAGDATALRVARSADVLRLLPCLLRREPENLVNDNRKERRIKWHSPYDRHPASQATGGRRASAVTNPRSGIEAKPAPCVSATARSGGARHRGKTRQRGGEPPRTTAALRRCKIRRVKATDRRRTSAGRASKHGRCVRRCETVALSAMQNTASQGNGWTTVASGLDVIHIHHVHR
jgi:hypothetical protein